VMSREQLAVNLIPQTWLKLESDELRLLLSERFGPGLGQYNGQSDRLYLPLAGEDAKIALTFEGNKIVAIEPGKAFDRAEWDRVSEEIQRSIIDGKFKTGREYSFSSFPVLASWRGHKSQIQICPAPLSAPRALGSDHPFIIEFPIKGSDLWFITNHRRVREHRRLTLLLNLLLAGRTTYLSHRPRSFWAIIYNSEPPPSFPTRIVNWFRTIMRICGICSRTNPNWPKAKWVQEGYFAPLGQPVIDEPSPSTAERIEEIEPNKYYANVGNDGRGLRVPTDLDESICRYLDLSQSEKAKFDRATFWLDMASRQWDISVSAAFAAFVSAIEALTERGDVHQYVCPVCGGHTQHEVPSSTRRFKEFIEANAPGVASKSRDEMYGLRSGILHGSKLIELDYALAFGWDPPWLNQRELIRELSAVTRTALRNWLKSREP
jgi:hypothetical protein